VQRKVTERNTPQVARSPGILPSDFASGLRGSLSAHPCARNELARILRATLRAFPPPARRATGAPFGRHPAAEAAPWGFLGLAPGLSKKQTITTTQCRDARFRALTGAVRGAEHRRVRRKLPEGARARCARVGCEHRDVLSDDPDVPEKRREFCRARCAAKHRVRCLAFLVTFWAMPKSNRLAAGETNALDSDEQQEQGAGFRLSPE